MHRTATALAFLLVAAPACSGEGGSGSSGTADGGSAAQAGNGGPGANGSGTAGSGNQGAGTRGSGTFRFGINHGNRNPSFNDTDQSTLSARVGTSSARVKLPEYHLDRWGVEIEVGDMNSYREHGKRELVAFLTGMTEAHSTAPAGSANWERDFYIPSNLHEPIWRADGSVNPDNYWASYLYQTMKTYAQWVTYWEIWNEPDWVSDHSPVASWETEPPTADQLPHFNGSIFDYVRMLRIATEVRDRVAPNTLIGLGGIGYDTFLDAILRYSDQPNDGAVDQDHPATGAAYFDAVIFHHYPHYTEGGSDAAVTAFVNHRDRLEQRLVDHGLADVPFIVTETGASHRSITGVPSGEAYARNYLLKMMATSQASGIRQVHWFILSDGDHSSDPDDPYSTMGLFEDIKGLATTDEAQLTPTGVAYRTMTRTLSGARYDASLTATLQLDAAARGYAFVQPDDDRTLVLWAHSGSSETATAAVTLPLEGEFEAIEWNGDRRTISAGDAMMEVTLSATPLFLVEGG